MAEYVETWDDLNKKYSDTFLKWRGNLCYCEQFGHSDNKTIAVLHFLGPKRGLHKEHLDYEESALEELHVDACMFNRTDGKPWSSIPENWSVANLLWRSPRRQWKRSLCPSTVQLLSPVQDLYAAIRKTPKWEKKLTLQSIPDLLEAKYPPINEAFQLLERFVCVAIGPNYCLSRSTISDAKALVSSKFGFIGEYGPKEGFIVHHEPATQELRDFVQRINQNVRIQHA